MTYKKMFAEDNKYQEMVAKYFNGVDTIKRGVKLQTINAKTANDMGNKLYAELQQNLKEYNVSKRQELESKAEQIAAQYSPQLDYESTDAKNIATRLKLKSQMELEDMATNPSEDQMGLHLLRLELKARGLDKLDNQLFHYNMQRTLEATQNDEAYQVNEKNIGALYTMGDRGLIVLDEYVSLETLPSQFNKKIRQEAQAASERGFDPSTSHTLVEEVRNNRDALAAIQ